MCCSSSCGGIIWCVCVKLFLCDQYYHYTWWEKLKGLLRREKLQDVPKWKLLSFPKPFSGRVNQFMNLLPTSGASKQLWTGLRHVRSCKELFLFFVLWYSPYHWKALAFSRLEITSSKVKWLVATLILTRLCSTQEHRKWVKEKGYLEKCADSQIFNIVKGSSFLQLLQSGFECTYGIFTFTHNSIKYMEKRHTYPRERDKSATLQLIPRATTTSTASSSPPSIATMDRSISHSWQFCGSSQRHLLSWALSTVTTKTAFTRKNDRFCKTRLLAPIVCM